MAVLCIITNIMTNPSFSLLAGMSLVTVPRMLPSP